MNDFWKSQTAVYTVNVVIGLYRKYAVSEKKDATVFLRLTLPNAGRFSKFFHRRI